MPRSPRIEFEGARYHVLSRGNRKETILGLDEDKLDFLDTLEAACEKTGWIIHSYVLMNNHFHLLLETPEPNLSAGMRWLQGTYGNRYNRRHGLSGHVWQGRFKSPVISSEGDAHFLAVSRYIHLNPARAGLLDTSKPRLEDYRWSSFPLLCSAPSKRPLWLEAASLFTAYALSGDSPRCRAMFRRRMELACRETVQGECDEEVEEMRRILSRGWYIGDPASKSKLIPPLDRAVSGRKKHSLSGSGKSFHNQQAACVLLRTACKLLDVDLDEVRGFRNIDLRKQMLAALLRSKTTTTYSWIIEHLNMGNPSSVYRAIRTIRTLQPGPEASLWNRLQSTL